jgi:hypothetical protein
MTLISNFSRKAATKSGRLNRRHSGAREARTRNP